MRSVTATLLSVLVAAWPMPLRSQATLGTISGVVSIDGRPLAGASLALVNLDTGDVHEVQSGASGAYEARVAPGSVQPPPGDRTLDGIAYRIYPTPRYQGNGVGRVRNIAAFLGTDLPARRALARRAEQDDHDGLDDRTRPHDQVGDG